MFTGLIEEVGLLQVLAPEADGARLTVAAAFSGNLDRGESVAVDGACLTVESQDNRTFSVFASAETLRRTTLGALAPGRPVNLERALAVGARLGGHWVQGHVDATGTLRDVQTQGNSRVVSIQAPESVLRFLVEKGSVAVDGISLTIASLDNQAFSLWIIPETWTATTLGRKRPGDPVNLECDLIAKCVFRYLEALGGERPEPGARDARLSALLNNGGWAGRTPSQGQ